MRRHWRWATATVVLVGLATPVQAKVTILHLMNPAHGDVTNKALQELAKEFNAAHSDIEVKLEMASGNYNEKLATMIAAGTPPDVAHVVNNQASVLLEAGALADMAQLAKRDGIDLNRLFPRPVLEALQWRGILFGLPIFAQAISVLFNVDLFARSGQLTPAEQARQGTWTWETYLQAAKKLTVDTNGDGQPDQFGTGINVSIDRMPIWVWQAGGDIFESRLNPRRSTFLSEPVRTALKYYTSWKLEHGVTGGSFAQGNQALNPFDGPWAAGNFAQVSFAWDVAPMARGPVSDVTGLFINNVQILQQSAKKEAAWQWVKFLALNQASAVAFVRATGRTPALLAAFPAYLNVVTKPPGRRVWLDLLSNSRPVALTPRHAEVNALVTQRLNQVLAGQMALEEALATLQKEVDAVLAR